MPRRNHPSRKRQPMTESDWTKRELTFEQMAARLVLTGLASPLILHDSGRATKDSVFDRLTQMENR